MALKIVDGFDHYNAAADFLTRSGFLQWQFPVSTPFGFAFVTGLSAAGKALQFGSSGAVGQIVRAVWADRNSEAFIGFRANIQLAANLQITLYDTVADSPQVTLVFNGAGYSVAAYRGSASGTLLGISANNAWTGATNQFVEIHFKIANSGGVIEVRIRDQVVLSISGVDTQNTANAWSDAMDLFPGGSTARIDDLYYCDTASDPGASPNNTYMGDLGVYDLFATGDGTVQWTRNGGSSNFGRVNEQAMDSDATYNFSATPGQEDQLTFQPITQVAAIIYGVFVTVATRKDDVGPRVIKTGLKSGATVSYGSNHSIPDTYAYFTDGWIVDPNTGANWTRTAVNNLLGLYNLVS